MAIPTTTPASSSSSSAAAAAAAAAPGSPQHRQRQRRLIPVGTTTSPTTPPSTTTTRIGWCCSVRTLRRIFLLGCCAIAGRYLLGFRSVKKQFHWEDWTGTAISDAWFPEMMNEPPPILVNTTTNSTNANTTTTTSAASTITDKDSTTNVDREDNNNRSNNSISTTTQPLQTKERQRDEKHKEEVTEKVAVMAAIDNNSTKLDNVHDDTANTTTTTTTQHDDDPPPPVTSTTSSTIMTTTESTPPPAPPSKYRITRGNGTTTTTRSTSLPSFFIVLSTPRSGGDYVMKTIGRYNNNETICSSGSFPLTMMFPQKFPIDAWVIHPECTYSYISHTITKLTSTSSSTTSQLPPQCEATYDASKDDNDSQLLQPQHREWICEMIRQLNGNYTPASILQLYLHNFATHTPDRNNLVPTCTCPSTSTVRGIKWLTADWIQNQPPYHQTKIAVGTKVIRLTRTNYWERYVSIHIPSQSKVWAISSEHDKIHQMETFRNVQYNVNIADMLHNFVHTMEHIDQINTNWIEQYSGETLWMDYAQLRDEPHIAYTRILQFLGVVDKDNGDDKANDAIITSVQRELNLQPRSEKWPTEYTGRNLLSYIANPDAVYEAIVANGYGHFIGVNEYVPIHHVIYSPPSNEGRLLRMSTTRPGLNVVILQPPLTDASSTIEHHGPSARFIAARPYLSTLSPDTIVILSEGTNGTVNHHIRDLSTFYIELGGVRRVMTDLTQSHPGTVLVSASSVCCPEALTHVEPGSLFDANGKRQQRTCRPGVDCHNKSSDKVALDAWTTFMKDRAASLTSSSKSIYVDASFVAGKASDLLHFIEVLDVHAYEDDRAVIMDYMYRYPDKIHLDYSHTVFAQRFDGVLPSSCSDTDYVLTSSPLFLHNARDQKCPLRSATIATTTVPLWDDASGIAIKPLLDHIDRVVIHDKSAVGIDRHFDKEILYIVDQNGFWGTNVTREQYRVVPTEKFLVEAYNMLIQDTTTAAAGHHRWSALRRTMETTGFLYWAWYGDWKHCSYHNVGDDVSSVPIFTTCAVVSCNYSFPSPQYMNIIDAQPTTAAQYEIFRQFDVDYPWDTKIRKVVWRGALSENNPKKVFDSQRWRLCKFVHELQDDPKVKDMFDVGLTTIPKFLTNQMDIDASLVGGTAKGIGRMNDFQKYLAVLDMDGNSWSSRFRTMLCYNSVAVKVEPAYIDYFFVDLVPWKHYVPIKNDLSDLVENIAFVLDPANDAIIREIIASANHWCTERSSRQALVYDMLDLWDSYIQLLDRADPNWTKEWDRKKQDIFAPSSNIPLVKLK